MRTFIRKNSDLAFGELNPWLVVNQEVETLKVSDTYGNYGQKVDACDAGDSIELLSSKAVEIANRVALEYDEDAESFEIGDFISACDNNDIYDDVLAAVSELKEFEDYTIWASTVEGFNYWDGSNWQTVTVSCEVGEPSHEILTDDDLIKELDEAIDEKSFIKEGFGTRIYESEKYYIVENSFASHFELYEIYDKEETDFEDISK